MFYYALDLKFKKQSEDCLSFVVAEHLKTSNLCKSLEVKFMSLPEDPSLCTMSTLVEYILRTEKLKKRTLFLYKHGKSMRSNNNKIRIYFNLYKHGLKIYM